MGSSESKVAALPATPKAKASRCQQVKNEGSIWLRDPRSPTAAFDRTPIQVDAPVSRTRVEQDCALPSSDPRSPSNGIARTPMKDVMRVTMGSIAQRLSALFQNEATDKTPAPHQRSSEVFEEVTEDGEVGSNEPLLSPQPSAMVGSSAEHADMSTLNPSLQVINGSSPFVLLGEDQMEVEADFTIEDAEEARESPFHKRLSMSLITCNEGEVSSKIFADVHHDLSSLPCADLEEVVGGTDHCYALPTAVTGPECTPTPVEPSTPGSQDVAVVTVSTEQPAEPQVSPSEEEDVEAVQEVPEESPQPTSTATPVQPSPVPSPVLAKEQPESCTGLRCPTFDTKSPSQVVFKPQWLGKGFGAPGLRARGLQARGGKGGSSPLAVSVAVKNNENRGPSTKLKQKGNASIEGRSPLQILKDNNSPRDQLSQKKLKVATPDRQRLGQMERRVLTVSLDKENR